MTERSRPTLKQKIQWLVEDLRPYDAEKMILFGSGARGDADEQSDLDVVIIKRTDQRFVQRGVEAVRFIRPEVVPVDLFVYTPEEFRRMREDENPFIQKVLSEGRVLYEKAA